jgi:hypothetical protein
VVGVGVGDGCHCQALRRQEMHPVNPRFSPFTFSRFLFWSFPVTRVLVRPQSRRSICSGEVDKKCVGVVWITEFVATAARAGSHSFKCCVPRRPTGGLTATATATKLPWFIQIRNASVLQCKLAQHMHLSYPLCNRDTFLSMFLLPPAFP